MKWVRKITGLLYFLLGMIAISQKEYGEALQIMGLATLLLTVEYEKD